MNRKTRLKIRRFRDFMAAAIIIVFPILALLIVYGIAGGIELANLKSK